MTQRKYFLVYIVAIYSLTSCGTIKIGNNGESDVLSGVGRIPGYDFGAAITLPEGFEIELPPVEGGLIEIATRGGSVSANIELIVWDVAGLNNASG